RDLVVRNKLGMHMRPATLFAQLAGEFQARIEVVHLGPRVDGRNIIDLITLAAGKGAQLTIEAEGPDAQQAVEALADLVEIVFPQEDTEQQQQRENQLRED